MDTFLQYILPSIIAIAVAIIAGVFGYLGIKRQTEKDLENIEKEHKLSNQSVIKNLHYEEKFRIYKDLSEKLLNMVIDSLDLFPPGLDHLPQDKDKRELVYQKRYDKACDSYNLLTKSLYSSAPFIGKDVFEFINQVRDKCHLQIIFYPNYVMSPDSSFDKDNVENKNKCWLRGSELVNDLDKCSNFLRDKLAEEENQE